MKHSNLYLGLVLPSGGWQSLIATVGVTTLAKALNANMLSVEVSYCDAEHHYAVVSLRP